MAQNTLTIRQRTAVNDLSDPAVAGPELSSAELQAVLATNGVLRAGIATDQEVGLADDRVMIICVPVAFGVAAAPGQQAPIHTPAEIEARANEVVPVIGRHHLVNAQGAPIVGRNITNAQMADIIAAQNAALAAPNAAPGVRASAHGAQLCDDADLDQTFAYDVACFRATYALNYRLARARHPNLSAGQHHMMAAACAQAFRNGYLEGGASREFAVCYIEAVDAGNFRVAATEPRAQAVLGPLNLLAVQAAVGVAAAAAPPVPYVAIQRKFLEIGMGAVVAAGFTHYSLNHTTGGRRLTGPVAPLLATNGLYTPGPARGAVQALVQAGGQAQASEEDQTTAVYEALHPVNKRAIASLFIVNTHVHGWYRPAVCPTGMNVELDSFLSMRRALPPAGSHKVYVARLVLAQLCANGLAVFLPWWAERQGLIDLVTDLRQSGARAHPGAMYYTDERGTFSQTDADRFLPDLAYYVQNRQRAATLANSPHLSQAIAATANANWRGVVDSLQSGAVDTTDKAALGRYLAQAGQATISVDLADPATYAAAITAQDAVAQVLRA